MSTNFVLRIFLLSILFASSTFMSAASDTLSVTLNRYQLASNDTLSIEASQKNCAKLATLHVWLEDISNGRKWHYRYPMINGFASIGIKIAADRKEGNYDISFAVQQKFVTIKGKWNTAAAEDKKNKLLTYFLLTKGKSNVADVIALNDELNFTLPNLLFEDSAYLFFSRPGKKKKKPSIVLETQLDSAFVPDQLLTKTFRICNNVNNCLGEPSDTISKWSAWKDQPFQTILPTISLNSKSKNTLKQFEQENVSGLFAGYADFVFDGFTDDDLANSNDLFLFLSTHVPGIKIDYDKESGMPSLMWRKKSTEVFLNEIRMESDMPLDIMPSDIALIKVYRPGTPMGTGSGEGGTVAVYLKNGIYNPTNGDRYGFKVFGYNALITEWK